MKRLSLAIALSALTVPALAEHGVPEEYGYVGIHATQHWFDIGGHVANPDFDDTQLFGVQAGLRMNEALSLQLWLETGDLDFESSTQEADLDQLFATVRWHYHDNELLGFEPYTGFTVGRKRIELAGSSDAEATLAGPEMGLQRAISQRLVLDLGVRPTYSFDDERWDGQLYAGLNLVFGKTTVREQAEQVKEDTTAKAKQAVQAATAPLDSDGDGVIDANDQCPDTPAGAKVDENGCPMMLERSVSETLNVQFETGGAQVKESSMADIERIAKVMVEYPETSLVIEGHTDSVGNADFNRRLSQQRADAVKAVLVERFEINADRIDAVGKGEDEPVADNGTAEGRAKNRRVETEISASRTEMQQ